MYATMESGRACLPRIRKRAGTTNIGIVTRRRDVGDGSHAELRTSRRMDDYALALTPTDCGGRVA
jgi:hypothetical protein